MALFVVLALVFAFAAFAFALSPLWRASWKFALALTLALCVGAFALYAIVGAPRALDPHNRIARQEAPAQAAESEADALVAAALSRMKADPQRHADAQAVQLLERALQLEPKHQRARWFFGVVLRQNGQAAQAAALWQTLLPDVDAGTAPSLRAQIDAARKDAGLPPLPAEAATPSLEIALDATDAVKKRFDKNASVFVIARIPNGPPMPVAVQKHALSDLPLRVRLSDADSLMPTRKLSSLREVDVLARLSADGDALHADAETPALRISFPNNKAAIVVLGK